MAQAEIACNLVRCEAVLSDDVMIFPRVWPRQLGCEAQACSTSRSDDSSESKELPVQKERLSIL
jgi:hypothetical protein